MLYFTGFDREIVSEMGEMGVLGPTIKGEYKGKKRTFYYFVLLNGLNQDMIFVMV